MDVLAPSAHIELHYRQACGLDVLELNEVFAVRGFSLANFASRLERVARA